MVEPKDKTISDNHPRPGISEPADAVDPADPRHLRLGELIANRYRLTNFLGGGAMGTVYEARQEDMERTVAVKILRREFAQNPAVVRRFHQEALAASRLTHPHTITVFDHGQSGDDLYITMECLRGRTLKAELAKQGRLPSSTTRHVLIQVLKSVAEAHRKGIVHRDLKPENIFLTTVDDDPYFVKVLDFGVAKLKTTGQDETLTQAGHLFGTPKYMAPEQAREGRVDARADVYSVGVMAYEMLVGQPPFVGENPLALLLAHANEAPRRMGAICPEAAVPEDLERIIFTALAKKRAHRQDSAEDFIDELNRTVADVALYQGAPLRDALEEAIQRAGATSTDGTGLDLSPPSQPRRKRSGMPLAIPILLLAATVLALIWAASNRALEESSTTRRTEPAPSAGTEQTPEANVAAALPAQKLVRPPVDADTASAAQTTVFTIGSLPAGAKVIDTKTEIEIGVTPTNLQVSKPMKLALIRSGFRRVEISVSPEQKARSIIRTLTPEAARRTERAPTRKTVKPSTRKNEDENVIRPAIVIRKRPSPQPRLNRSPKPADVGPLELD
ncbi:MAG: serine/threonine-protein kinase [Myxococcota bacterium]|nr:serine/threonine-protein kinase [Myxococcota bacterium]